MKAIVKKILTIIPMFIGISFLIFFMVTLSCPDPLLTILGSNASPEAINQYNAEYGFDKGIVTQFFLYGSRAVGLNLGKSFMTGLPVVNDIAKALPVTLKLAFLTLIFTVITAIPMAIYGAKHKNSWFNKVGTLKSLVASSFSTISLAFVFRWLFELKLGWLPPVDIAAWLSPSPPTHSWPSYILPIGLFGIFYAILLFVKVRENIFTALETGSKNASFSSAVKRATPAIIKSSLWIFSIIWGMTFIVERIFTIPGMGRLFVISMNRKDSQVVIGVLITMAAVFCLIRLICDISSICMGKVRDEPARIKKNPQSFNELWHNFIENPAAVVGLVMLILVITLALCSSFIIDPQLGLDVKSNAALRLSPPNSNNILGTDEFGRDVFSRVVHSIPNTVFPALWAAVISLIVGSLLGLLAGYFRGWCDRIIMGIVSFFSCLPGLLLPIVLTMGKSSDWVLVPIIAFSLLLYFIPAVRNAVISSYGKKRQGTPLAQALKKDIIPGILPDVLQFFFCGLRMSILAVIALTFLGHGISNPTPSWGGLLTSSMGYLQQIPQIYIVVFISIFVTLLSINLISYGLGKACEQNRK